MSRYAPLSEYLSKKKGDRWEATFQEVEEQLGFALPPSAHRYPAWWANQTGPGHSQTAGWRSAGWRTSGLDLERKRVRFERDRRVEEAPATALEDHAADEEQLLARARELTGISDRRILVTEGLRSLIAREAGFRLARLGGTMPDYQAPSRERPAL